MSAVCQHRAMQVCEGAGNDTTFKCPYHHWNYALDGRLLGIEPPDHLDACVGAGGRHGQQRGQRGQRGIANGCRHELPLRLAEIYEIHSQGTAYRAERNRQVAVFLPGNGVR